MRLLLGIDVGGSRTRALVADVEGAVLGYGEAGPGNHEVVGYEGLVAAMDSCLGSALEAAGLRAAEALPRFGGAGFGIAGFDWESERAPSLAAVARLGLACPLELHNDAALGLAAGASSLWGVNLVAGTSNNCYGLSREGREGRIAGAGAAVGEQGGALEIAARALAAVNHARIGRCAHTSLGAVLCRLTGSPSPDELIEAVSRDGLGPDPAWAPEVFAAARGGDRAAMGIIDWAGRELGESAAAVVRQLGLEGLAFELVLSGSLFSLEPSLEAGIVSVLAPIAPGAAIRRLDAPPVAGALLLAARAAGLDPGSLRASILSGARAMVAGRVGPR